MWPHQNSASIHSFALVERACARSKAVGSQAQALNTLWFGPCRLVWTWRTPAPAQGPALLWNKTKYLLMSRLLVPHVEQDSIMAGTKAWPSYSPDPRNKAGGWLRAALSVHQYTHGREQLWSHVLRTPWSVYLVVFLGVGVCRVVVKR